MMRHSRSACVVACLLIMAGSAIHAQNRTFYVGEHTNFSACGGTNLNAITPQFVDYLRDRGWSGQWYMEGNAWPQDLREDSFPGGFDRYYGDANNLSAYAGHGFTDARLGLSYGTPHSGSCRLDIDAEMRLGERVTLGGNGKASFFFAMTSCTMYRPRLFAVWIASGATRGLAQAFGFHDSPKIKGDEPRQFLQNVRASSSRSNKTEWLNKMDNCGPWYWFCSNSPMVLSLGEGQTHARNIHYRANLFYRYTNPWIDGPTYYYYSYIDNGHGPCR